MDRIRNLIFCITFIFISIPGINAQFASSASATGHVIAEVIPVFSATETAQMNFGRFSPGPAGGEIILTPESTVSVLGSVYSGTGTHNAASFYISGDAGASFTVTLPNDPVVLRHTSSAKTMVIDDWVSNPVGGIGAGILHEGSKVVYVGATLKVGRLEDNPVGIYAGTYTITFDFN
jgi:hypothetical protein